jgi:hypothetical protein
VGTGEQHHFQQVPSYAHQEEQRRGLAIVHGIKKIVEFLFFSVYDFKRAEKDLRVPIKYRNLQDSSARNC